MFQLAPEHLSVPQTIQHGTNVKFYALLICCLLSIKAATAFTITGRYCQRNVSVKYQEPVLHMNDRQHVQRSTDYSDVLETAEHNTLLADVAVVNITENYLTYEPRVRWETTKVCCPGYSPLLFGFCEPICATGCPRYSHCATPNQCQCLPGYEEHHPNNKKLHQLDCRPVCANGCPLHSQCVARNRCHCREGFRNTSKWWFLPLKCERIQCAASDQRYDVAQRLCVKIEMSMEELMRKVAERLTKGLSNATAEDSGEQSNDEEAASEELDNKIGPEINT
ncbi:multiple epidermal growth factor-like domains protein 10 [Bactrocera neohumeralis]|uniref:multiple epidermal growth factor-like domains protein 10 n=1 Tax=Bactrocera neohumeralis TaxID=98809 RepID=UPI00216566EE|nr:multiple epidermal growth factor-like domains protein 10 [Bactrocera neohumeralis]